jgi:FlaA1/EpsC-like NDP-sugar epimerase
MFKKVFIGRIKNIRLKVINRYFRAGLIVLIDTAMSLMASLCTLLLIIIVLQRITFNTIFTIEWFALALVATVAAIIVVKPYRTIIRYSMLNELSSVCLAGFGKELIMLIALSLFAQGCVIGLQIVGMVLIDLFITIVFMVGVRIAMNICYRYILKNLSRNKNCQRVLVYGVSDKSVAILARLSNSPHFNISGFICDDVNLNNHKIGNLPVYAFTDKDSVSNIVSESGVDGILFAYGGDARKERERLMEYINEIDCRMFIAPSIDEVKDGKLFDKSVRKIKIEDLLGRPEIKISMDEIISNFKDKTILVTGAAGSIGSELCRQLATFGIKQLVMFDNAETPLHNVRLEFEEKFPDLKFIPVIGDVRQVPRLDFVFRQYRPQVVFHAAAYKHVPLMEENPCEAVLVNVDGSRNVADKCLEYGVEKMVMISTDKAVNPTNIMGCTKRLAEIYVQSLGLAIEQGKIKGTTKFVTTRFGNVLGSNGSVIPHFNAQIAAGGPVTVTHPDIVRFFMSIPEACRLVMEAATISTGNQICVFDMGKPIKIAHLAEQMIRLAGLKLGEDIEIKYTGLRPGEKLYEEVLATKENTVPTNHDSIFIAKVRSYDYDEAKSVTDRLRELSRSVEIPDMVRLMKATVPEFKSKNSIYEQYDK